MDHREGRCIQRHALQASRQLPAKANKVSDTICHKHLGSAMHSTPPTLSAMTSTPPSTSTKDGSPSGLVRPKARLSMASWVPLAVVDFNDQDLPPTRKLSLSRYFKAIDEDDDDEFLLIPPREAKSNISIIRNSLCVLVQGCSEGSIEQAASTSTYPCVLPRRQNLRTNPFANNGYLLRSGGVEYNGPVPLTPPSRTSSPPPFSHQTSSLENFGVPERLLLPSV